MTEHDRRQVVGLGVAVEPASQPAGRGMGLGRLTGHPPGHGGEVAHVGLQVTDALEEGHLAGLVPRRQLGQVRVQADALGDGQRGALLDGERASLVAVEAVVDRDHRVQPVVPTGHEHEHEHAVVGSDRRRRLGHVGQPRRQDRGRAGGGDGRLQEPAARHGRAVGG
ncbi:MAG TPA: hypothetical protein VFU93_03305 [Acidimicrobiales bacterium]|nr:hypothetical protein [Acidimicrobiales bacterium]